MAVYLEPKDGDFQKLAEQLVNQSQTKLELKQSLEQQADLEASKAKIQNSHRHALQELKKENQAQFKLQSQNIQAPSKIAPAISTDMPKRSASATAHELHKRPQTAAQTAHSLHQRPQLASTTAQTTPQGKTQASAVRISHTSDLIKQTQDPAANSKSAELFNPQQQYSLSSKLTLGQYIVAVCFSITMSVFLTFSLSLALGSFLKLYPPVFVMAAMWGILFIVFCGLLLARFKKINQRNTQFLRSNSSAFTPYTNQAVGSSTKAQAASLPLIALVLIFFLIFVIGAPFVVVIGLKFVDSMPLAVLMTVLLFLAIPFGLFFCIQRLNRKKNASSDQMFTTNTNVEQKLKPQIMQTTQAQPSDHTQSKQQTPQLRSTAHPTLQWFWGSTVVSGALTAILYGAVLEDFLRRNPSFNPLLIVPICFVVTFLVVSTLMRSKLKKR